MNAKIKFGVIFLVVGFAFAEIGYDLRGFLPSPGGYITRAHFLKGWSSRGGYGLNCAGFISNAHGSSYFSPEEFYNAAPGQIELVLEFSNRSQIDESVLRPGDIAAWHGVHVAIFIKPGVWMDGDSRRGYVDSYRLQDKPASDPWFQGRVRIVRWVGPGRYQFKTNFSTIDQGR